LATSAAPSQTAAPVTTPIPLPTFAQVAAAGNGVLWMDVNGDHLFVSLDRGATWTERSLPGARPSGSVAFVNERDGWFLETLQPLSQCLSQDVVVWRTQDGARTWAKLSVTGLANLQCKSSVAFVDTDRGYIPTYDENRAPMIYRTADGGRTWSASAPLPDPPGFVTAAAGRTLRVSDVADFGSVLYADALGFNDSSRYYVYRSTDRGATWSFVSMAPIQATPVVLSTPTRWLQIGPGSSQETSDSGASWHAYVTDYGQAAPVAPQFAFGDATTGYATVRGGLQRTIDGGAHWTSLKTPGT
jgi:photosystem II stability/assembly factor-like uncharacterized protein